MNPVLGITFMASKSKKTVQISGRVAELGEIVDFTPILGTKKSFVLRVHQVYMVPPRNIVKLRKTSTDRLSVCLSICATMTRKRSELARLCVVWEI